MLSIKRELRDRRYVQPKKEKDGFNSIGYCEENLGINLKIKDKHPDKTKEWWYDTHGIDLSLI
jgi:hypothetical protein